MAFVTKTKGFVVHVENKFIPPDQYYMPFGDCKEESKEQRLRPVFCPVVECWIGHHVVVTDTRSGEVQAYEGEAREFDEPVILKALP